jgi:CcmD family protein
MNVSRFLYHYGQYVAYAAAWLIHGTYIGSLFRRYNRLRQEMKELQHSSK